MKILKNQKGFGLMEGVLVVIALTLIVFVGFYVYNANKEEPATESSAPQQEQENDQSAQAEEPDTTQYLEIKEYGVKVPLSDDLLDASYYAEDGQDLDGKPIKYVYVSSASLERAAKVCSDEKFDSSIESFIGLSKVSGKYNKASAEGNLLKQFDTFYIAGGHPNGSQCTTSGAAAQAYGDKVNELNESFAKAFENATLIQ